VTVEKITKETWVKAHEDGFRWATNCTLGQLEEYLGQYREEFPGGEVVEGPAVNTRKNIVGVWEETYTAIWVKAPGYEGSRMDRSNDSPKDWLWSSGSRGYCR
jgi:hypothetical protein